MNRLQTANAFVVQFRDKKDDPTGTLCGRLEHITSGTTVIFQSVNDLPAIFRHMLDDLNEQRLRREHDAK